MPRRTYNYIENLYRFPVFSPSDWGSSVFEETADLSKGAIIVLRDTSDLINGLFDHILFK
jgi:hypothetical protein